MEEKKKVTIFIIVIVAILLIAFIGYKVTTRSDEEKNNDPNTNEIEQNQNSELNSENNDTDTNDTIINEQNNYVGQNTNLNVSEVVSKPIITLNGSNYQYVELGEEYLEEGAVAQDEKDGDLTSKIVITSNVDSTKLGVYVVVYTVSNTQGESSSVIRTVEVIDETKPIVELKEQLEVKDGKIIVNADKTFDFILDSVELIDNDTDLTMSYVVKYRPFENEKINILDLEEDNLFEEINIEEFEIAPLGYYLVSYLVLDSSGNESEITNYEFILDDITAPSISVDNEGNDQPEMEQIINISAKDNYSDVLVEYSFSSSIDTPSTWEVLDESNMVSPTDGVWYLHIKATDNSRNSNETIVVYGPYHKKSDILVNENFNLNKDSNYTGINVGFKVNHLSSIHELTNIEVSLYHDDKLLATNKAIMDMIHTLELDMESIKLSTPFIVNNGTYVETYWEMESYDYTIKEKPNKAVITITTQKEGMEEVISTVVNDNLLETADLCWGNMFYHIIVDKDGIGNYKTVQDAIDNSIDGNIIFIFDGTYVEEIDIFSKMITIEGESSDTIITLTSSPSERTVIEEDNNVLGKNPIIFLKNSTVRLSNLTIKGTDLTDAKIDGITIVDSHLDMNKVNISEIRNTTYSNDDLGRGVVAYGESYLMITESVFDTFNKIGMHLVGEDVTAHISNSIVTGYGEYNENYSKQTGIVFENGASGSVSDTILNNLDTAISYENINNIELSNNTYNNCTTNYTMTN